MNTCQAFRALHERNELFVMPNAWCEGSARLIQQMGYASIGTTSAGIAYAKGYRDSSPSMDNEDRFAAIDRIVRAVDIPVTADLENGLAKTLEQVEEHFRRALSIGCAGASIEDISDYSDPNTPLYFPIAEACDRVRAASGAVHALDADFIVTARTDYLLGANEYSLNEVVARLVAFEEAGADCLFAPGVRSIEDLEVIRRSLTKPLSVIPVSGMTVDRLRTIGIRRISLGSSLFRAAYRQISTVLLQLENPDGLDFLKSGLSLSQLDDVMR
ncbi:carboxyphosphonoenolpyruvate phosphonomutase [Pseudomonas coronafaciens pv. porri]|uniref:Carboxyphosphonoenolpyruvate phosphonomutase n=1 Tax=Pseudomonas coronafaciens pv. porri TaxID=83964 RepID=A0ABR5JLI6_9PSED|nr:isocitrate lyase/phosphoenolpyruvate mutase family protein [Pseudomonas coronafaciens]KOP54950.1 carboxyphosphonoenolpyruvate phosphonomutase [Pseudomonas coronafaciens pv. porri]KOP55282.1 carboxyphosphonoenolpyruvate phosphonomutase [Pseudomonas coronafaciens pv. porri]KPB55846.1 Carboxyphosphonoenolpyruvate phosphonomutase-like protein [Pseudomonas coronafaciens pv. oryzae]KPY07012.1 Carboxyphosphonoenolpyruvate phosphonomutase-like protein [Pseudomonas coronafaciens pv. oryzae]KPY26463.